MYERLWDAEPPQLSAAQRRASAAARAHAVAHSWLPPLAWDDVDDDPDPDPTECMPSSQDDSLDEIAIERAMSGDAEVRLTYAEQVEVVRRLSQGGRSIRTIADVLSTSTRTVSRHRKQSSAA
jgi:DNA-binding CsgD family transcriptional regulator